MMMFHSADDDADLAEAGTGDVSRRKLWIDGQCWWVHEIAAPSFDRRGGTHLLFESLEVIRRVRVFPADWQSLGDAELYALSLDLRPSHKRDSGESTAP